MINHEAMQQIDLNDEIFIYLSNVENSCWICVVPDTDHYSVWIAEQFTAQHESPSIKDANLQ